LRSFLCPACWQVGPILMYANMVVNYFVRVSYHTLPVPRQRITRNKSRLVRFHRLPRCLERNWPARGCSIGGQAAKNRGKRANQLDEGGKLLHSRGTWHWPLGGNTRSFGYAIKDAKRLPISARTSFPIDCSSNRTPKLTVLRLE
jgi:hypothetical protein